MSSEDVSKDQVDANQQNDEWIVQAKTRRLVPQHSLSRQDLEADKNKVPTTPKKVIRFTKEEMMTFRQPAKLLSNMAEMVEVISLDRLNPVCFERFEPEDVIRIWNLEKKGPPGGVDAAGRGRGRGKTFRDEQAQGSGEHVPGDWSTARSQPQSNKGGLWDDAGASGAGGADNMDLGDFAAMALKFRAEMEQMKLSGEADGDMGGLGGEEDMMDRLMREQNSRGGDLEDEEEMPDWATEEVAPAAAPQPAAKRSLLLETLNVKPAVAAAPAPVPVVQQPASVPYDSIGSLNHNHASLLAPVPALLRVEPTEWQYMDPQGNVQGPFEQDNMRAWHEAGYFTADLPIKLRHWTGFHIFQTVFPDSKNAFLSVPSEPGSSLLLSLQQQQQQQLLRQQQLLQEQQRQAEEHARQQHLLQQQKLEQERANALRQQQLQQQQQEEEARRQQLLLQQQREQALLDQQRFLLEQERLQAANAAAQAAAQPAPKPATVAPWANKQPGPNRTREESLLAIQSEEKARAEEEKKRQAAEQAKISKGWSSASGAASGPSLAEIQQQEEAARQRQAQAEASRAQQAAPATTNMSFQLKNLLGVKAPAAPAAASSGPAWGTSAAAPAAATGNKGSLRDIMQQEEVSEGVSPVKGASASTGAPRKPLSWAAKAGSSGPAIFTAPVPAAAPAPAPRAAPKPVVAAPVAAPAAAKPVSKTANKEKSDFGGKEMSKDMADWCVTQLKRLKGSDDLTLVQFCMSLDSAVEVRQYLSEYLGSSPEVTNFATDFIKYKEGGRRAVGSDSSAPSASASSANANNNNPSAFVSANKKKKGSANK